MKSREASRSKTIEAKIKPVNKISISEEIAQQIMDLISEGHLKPGQRLPPERDLCKHFGIGRSSLREALRCLSIMGVLDARVGEGTSVAVDGVKFLGKVVEWRLITEKHEIEDLLEVRIALESVAVGRVATLRRKEELVALSGLLKKMEAALGDAKKFAALDLQFHITIAQISDNALLSDLISMIRGQLVRGVSTVLLLPDAIALSLKEHRSIFRAIERGDPDAARKAMQAHLEAALARYRTSSENQFRVRETPSRFAHALS
jgi:GntR family transcriptional repressor for pyruvate dehydrogenase complex